VPQIVYRSTLKGQCHEICFWFFHESVSPKPLIIPLGPFQFFSKIRGDIRSSRFVIGVVDTGGKWKKSSIRKFVLISFGHLLEVELAYRFFQQFDNCSHRLPPVSFTPVENFPPVSLIPVAICHWCHLPPISTTLAKMVEKSAAGVVDTGGIFATGFVDTGGAP
jgi:hypothetical protein